MTITHHWPNLDRKIKELTKTGQEITITLTGPQTRQIVLALKDRQHWVIENTLRTREMRIIQGIMDKIERARLDRPKEADGSSKGGPVAEQPSGQDS